MEEQDKSKEITKLVNTLISRYSEKFPDLYYSSAADVADLIYENIQKGEALSHSEKELLKDISKDEVQYILSYERKAKLKR